MRIKKSRGFTLIELLVVIAIIGILAAIVLVSLKSARDRAKDARIQSNMGQIRATAELEYSTDDDYDDIGCGGAVADKAACASCTSADIKTLCEDIIDQGGESLIIQDNTTDKYCAEVKLKNGKYWCVDYNLISKRYDTDPGCAITPAYDCE